MPGEEISSILSHQLAFLLQQLTCFSFGGGYVIANIHNNLFMLYYIQVELMQKISMWKTKNIICNKIESFQCSKFDQPRKLTAETEELVSSY